MKKIKVDSLVLIKPNRMDDYKIYHSLGIYGEEGVVKVICPNKMAIVEVFKREYHIPVEYLEPIEDKEP